MAVYPSAGGSLPEPDSPGPDEPRRGRLKIFFGYAAGVGKTYAMLSEAHTLQKDGTEVVAGYIEPHVRPETTALLEGLEQLPPFERAGKDNVQREFDLDGAIRRRPKLILLDELAHTNLPGCRHKKRYQDAEELLRAGIDVYTTVNVQHIESLKDVVASITGISVRERIPDSLFDSADQVELVDIEPAELIGRLHKGKIYREEQARKALTHFFVKDKLIALRELALRYTADRVGRIAMHVTGNSLPGGYNTKEHILVCLSSAASNRKVIRTAARMADAFHGNLTALYVENSQSREMYPRLRNELRRNLRLAEQLGAQIATVYGDDIPLQIAEYARVSRVSKIVLGKSPSRRSWLPSAHFVDKLAELAPNIDIHIIPDSDAAPAFIRRKPRLVEPPKLTLAEGLKTLGILAACTAAGLWFRSLGIREANIITLYLLGVLLIATVTRGRLYSAAASILSVVVFNFLFTEPYYSLRAYDSGYPITFIVMLTASFLTGTLTKRVKDQARQSAQKAYRTEVLLETSRLLQQAKDIPSIMEETARQLTKLLERSVMIYNVAREGLSAPQFYPKDSTDSDPVSYTSPNERAVAEWVLRNNKRAGATTDTFSAAECLYHAVRSGDTVFAVAGVVIGSREEALDVFEKSLMIAMLDECALALEKEYLNEQQKRASLQIQQEQLRANLLRAISHDLRTPLTSISGNAGILISNSAALKEEQKRELYTDIYDDSMWLFNLVENLLSISRIDNETIQLQLQAELLEEVIAEALLHINRAGAEHVIRTELGDDLLMARMDPRLIIQVLINLVDNAIKYTQPGSHITLSARPEGGMIRVEVSDDGPGIAASAKEKLFEMFYTADNGRSDGRRGLGLGLFLCKTIVNAHGGVMTVRDNPPQGTVFSFTLQSEEVSMDE
ncbi:sensor histidine kinase ['Paenibacillus yunnanensis' Narsing Rao et al. 2020]|uniref:sensor histidine kinase n=1 Tax=Paenibacillus tengchongensis TaxID=2608684 RepID=UPI00124E4E6C|nr:sensor histidine kinase KdpD [Paenibacillus tengchongensis]